MLGERRKSSNQPTASQPCSIVRHLQYARARRSPPSLAQMACSTLLRANRCSFSAVKASAPRPAVRPVVVKAQKQVHIQRRAEIL